MASCSSAHSAHRGAPTAPQSTRPRRLVRCSLRSTKPRRRCASIPSRRRRTGAARSHAGTSRAEPGTSRESPRRGSVEKPIAVNTAPSAVHLKRGPTSRPAATRRVLGASRGIAPMCAPGTSFRCRPPSALTSARTSRRLSADAFAAKKGSIQRSPAEPTVRASSRTGSPWSRALISGRDGGKVRSSRCLRARPCAVLPRLTRAPAASPRPGPPALTLPRWHLRRVAPTHSRGAVAAARSGGVHGPDRNVSPAQASARDRGSRHGPARV